MANFYLSDGSNVTSVAVADGTTQTTPTVDSKLTGALFAAVGNTDTKNANSGTQNFATTYTIPANYLVANKVLRVTLCFSLTTSAATVSSIGITLLIGGVTVFAAVSAAPAVSLTGLPVVMVFTIQGTGAAGASVAVHVHPKATGVNSNAFVPFRHVPNTTATPVNLPTNGAMVIQPQYVSSNSTAGNSMTLQQFIVEALA